MKLNTIEVKTIDRKEAARMLAAFTYERQRRVNSNYVAYYARMMSRREWLAGTEIEIAYAPNGDGHKYGHLINGRHRLMAVIEADVSVDFVVKTFDCDNDTEVAKLYGMIDTGRSRNIGDYMRALAVDHEFGFTPSDNIKVGTAAAFILNGFRNTDRLSFSPEERLEALRKYSVAASSYLELLADIGTRSVYSKLRTSAVMSVALVTLDEATSVFGDDKVERFWTGIGLNDGLRLGDPRKVAHTHLFEYLNVGKSSRRGTSFAPYTARYIANCFNAWVTDRELKFTRVSDSSAPINIAGTSFKG